MTDHALHRRLTMAETITVLEEFKEVAAAVTTAVEADEAEERRRREAARERAEQEARRRDEARRAEVFDDIQSAIAALDVSDETAAAVTTALTAGRVPHITVNY